jgi:hypothetical protein
MSLPQRLRQTQPKRVEPDEAAGHEKAPVSERMPQY